MAAWGTDAGGVIFKRSARLPPLVDIVELRLPAISLLGMPTPSCFPRSSQRSHGFRAHGMFRGSSQPDVPECKYPIT
jgi:hypothetical protein